MMQAYSLQYRIGERYILDDVSVDIHPGQVMAVLGANGCGKSTLIKCLSGTLTPNAGYIELEGKSLHDYSLQQLSLKRAVLAQLSTISFPFTALDIVMMGRNPYIERREQSYDYQIARDVLEAVDGWHLRDRIFPTLSGGEQQRIQLARVLAQLWNQTGAYLLLDEPTSALDLRHQHAVLRLANDLARDKNFAVCMVLHDIALSRRYCDKVLLLKNGRIQTTGRAEEILRPRHLSETFDVPEDYLTQV